MNRPGTHPRSAPHYYPKKAVYVKSAARAKSRIDPSCYLFTDTVTDAVFIISVQRSEHCADPSQIFCCRWICTTVNEPLRNSRPPIRATGSVNVQPRANQTILKPTFCVSSVLGNTSRAHHEIPEGLRLRPGQKRSPREHRALGPYSTPSIEGKRTKNSLSMHVSAKGL